MLAIDWIFLVGTLLFIACYGVWRNQDHSSIKSYIKGDNKARWWTVGFSVMATQASAITFLSTPGQAYNEGMGFVQFYFGLPFAMIIICLFFLPVYQKLNVYTAYEFLENRFDLKTRTLTAILFLIQRGLAAGITIYAPAIILSVALGWNLKILVILIGLVVIFYTLIGGTNAVNVTQKQQMIIIIIGLISAFWIALLKMPENIDFSYGFCVFLHYSTFEKIKKTTKTLDLVQKQRGGTRQHGRRHLKILIFLYIIIFCGILTHHQSS